MTFPTYVHLGPSLPSQEVSNFYHAGGFLKGNYSPDVVTTGLALSPLELHLNGITWDVRCLCLASSAQHVSARLPHIVLCHRNWRLYIHIPLHILRPNRDTGASTLTQPSGLWLFLDVWAGEIQWLCSSLGDLITAQHQSQTSIVESGLSSNCSSATSWQGDPGQATHPSFPSFICKIHI